MRCTINTNNKFDHLSKHVFIFFKVLSLKLLHFFEAKNVFNYLINNRVRGVKLCPFTLTNRNAHYFLHVYTTVEMNGCVPVDELYELVCTDLN